MRTDIELLRIISDFGIVWFHSANPFGREIAYGGLIFFVIIAAYFNTISHRSNQSAARFKRLIIPCIPWAIVYGLLNFVGTGQICARNYSLFSCLLATPSLHLWYLPYIYAVSILINWSKTMFSKKKLGISCGMMAIALILSAPIWRAFNLIFPLDSYLHALPAVLIGIYLGCHNSMGQKLKLFILSGIMTSILVMAFVLPQGVGIAYLAGTLPSLLLLRSDILKKYQLNITPISSLMYGVYLVHFAFILVFLSLGFNHYSLPIVVFLLSIILIFTLKKLLPKNIYQYLF